MTTLEASFPATPIEVMVEYLEELWPKANVETRPLRPTDPNLSIGLFAKTWTPSGDQIGAVDPLINRYDFEVHLLHKSSRQSEGSQEHSRLTKSLRRMLYGDRDLHIRLAAITEVSDGRTERFQRMKVTSQNFMANEVKGNFLFLSVTQLYVETESV